MRNPLIYHALGLSSPTRKRRFAEKLLRSAERCEAQKLPTRIPFLKASFCGQDVPQGQTCAIDMGERPEGARIFIGRSLRGLANPHLALQEAIAFNSSYAGRGLQFFFSDDKEGHFICLRLIRAKTRWIGDLKLSMLQSGGQAAGGMRKGAAYFDTLFQVFMRSDLEDIRRAIMHEEEHARHLSLWRMIGLPGKLFPHADREYLAMMVPLIQHGDTSLVRVTRHDLKSNLEMRQTQYVCASARFLYRLAARYSMPTYEADMAVGAELIPDEVPDECFELLENMRCYARMEYKKEYARIFGIGLDDIREVISGLPMV